MATTEAPRATTPPVIQAPTAKERKYDRQLRLWAASGQRALEESHVLLVVGEDTLSNSSTAGAESLKNLILPSVGHFTIADSAKVTPADLGVNFFLEPTSIGKSRAGETCRLLQELNPDVEGHTISDPLSDWLTQPSALSPYNLILACGPMALRPLTTLSTYALERSIPLVYIRSLGFYSTFSVQLPPEFAIVDTHPDPDSTQDLRLLAPWPELEQAVPSPGDISSMPDHEHGHIPYILILLRCLEEWKDTHDGNPPSSFKEKTEFREFVRSQARTSNPEGGEENFDEACAAVLKTISPPPIGSGCREMFSMEQCEVVSSSSANFWLVAHAVRKFYNTHGVLPLPGSLPDMKATSADYVKLQNIYKSKARTDVAEVTSYVRELESSLSKDSRLAVPSSEIEQFCKNASHVRVLTNASKLPIPELRLFTSASASTSSPVEETLLDKLSSMLQGYDTISAVFVALNKDHIPTSTLERLKSLTDPITDLELRDLLDKTIDEVGRCEGRRDSGHGGHGENAKPRSDIEMHNTSSVTGGMVAQEAIKLLTRQYVPVDGTCIWDGIRSKTEIVKL